MIAVKIEIWPHGRIDRTIHHTTIVAANDGTGTRDRGNYQAITVDPELAPERQRFALIDAMFAGTTAKVADFPRGEDQQHLPSLVAALIHSLGLDEIHAQWATEV